MKKKIFIPNFHQRSFYLTIPSSNFFLGLQKLRFPTVRAQKVIIFSPCPALPCQKEEDRK
jgi:hypothetical protein